MTLTLNLTLTLFMALILTTSLTTSLIPNLNHNPSPNPDRTLTQNQVEYYSCKPGSYSMQTEGSDTKPLFADDRSKAGEYIVPGEFMTCVPIFQNWIGG